MAEDKDNSISYPVSYEKCHKCPVCSLVTKNLVGADIPEREYYYQCLAMAKLECIEGE